MITLYHATMTRSVRPRWALEELGQPYELVNLDRAAGDLDTPDFRKLNLFGRIPALVDQNGENEVALFESGAIVQYLLETYDDGALHPETGSPDWAPYVQWLHAAETFMQPVGLYVRHTIRNPEPERIAQVAEESRTLMDRYLQAVEEALEGRSYLVGERFSGADMMMGYALVAMSQLQLTSGLPNTDRYVESLSSRPACQKAFS
jgi:glutathione S-transferase